MKETEEDTFVRVFNKMIQKEHGCKDFADYWDACKKVPDCVNYSQWLQVVKDYASERLKSYIPSEEEIETQIKELYRGGFIYEPSDFKQGVNYIIELLTKGTK